MELFFYSIGIVFFFGLLAIALPEKLKGVFTAFGNTAALSLPIFRAVETLLTKTVAKTAFELPFPFGSVSFSMDSLSAFFVLLICLIAIFATFYSIGYLKPYNGKKYPIGSHYFFLNLLIISMLGVVTVQNTFAFLFIWELMSLSSFVLILFDNRKKETVSAAMTYFIMMHIGWICLVIGFFLAYSATGSFEFSALKTAFEKMPSLYYPVFFLLFAGFGMKAGFVPLHHWLPQAHPAAPSHVSALMSGVMIKTGIYGILRLLTMMGIPTLEVGYFILIVSIITAFYGIVQAMVQRDMKTLLAYSSVENIGIIGIGIGIGVLGQSYQNTMMMIFGYAGAFLHLLNHSLFKSMLFFGAGIVYNGTHTRDIEKLGGLMKRMPMTGMLFLIGVIAITGLPPLNGFIGEFAIYLGMFSSMESGKIALTVSSILSIAALSGIGVVSLITFTKAFGVAFLGSPRSAYPEENSTSRWMILTMAMPAVLCILIGLFPQFVYEFILTKVILIPEVPGRVMETGTIFTNLSYGLWIFIGIMLAVVVLRAIALWKKPVTEYKTWDCGYQAGNSRIQYTGYSYQKLFMYLVRPLAGVKVERRKPEGLFPKKSFMRIRIFEKFNRYIFQPIGIAVEKAFDFVSRVQTGNTQSYILFGVIFLLILLVWAVVGA